MSIQTRFRQIQPAGRLFKSCYIDSTIMRNIKKENINSLGPFLTTCLHV